MQDLIKGLLVWALLAVVVVIGYVAIHIFIYFIPFLLAVAIICGVVYMIIVAIKGFLSK